MRFENNNMIVGSLMNKKCEYDEKCPNDGTDAVGFNRFKIGIKVYFFCPRHADYLVETQCTPCMGMACRLTDTVSEGTQHVEVGE